jgi:hypothetical protein
MRVLLGSHRPSMQHWSNVLAAEHKQMLPRVHGLSPSPSGNSPSFPEHVPPPTDGGPPWERREPSAMTARRGQILVLCSTTLHSAWQNEDTVTRKALGPGAWIPLGVPAGLPRAQLEQRAEFTRRLRERLPPSRRHIVGPEAQFFETDYEPKWPETFAPGAKM